MTMFRFDPGDLFSCADIFASECTMFGVVLNDGAALVIRKDLATSRFSIQRTRLPHAAAPLTPDGPQMSPEVRLALEAVIIAMSIQCRRE